MITQVVGTTVALAILILILVRELQIGTTHDRLTIGQTDAVVPVLGRCYSIAVVLQISGRSIVFHIVVRERLTQALAVVSAQANREVTSAGVKLSVILSPTTYALIITVSQAVTDITISNDALSC